MSHVRGLLSGIFHHRSGITSRRARRPGDRRRLRAEPLESRCLLATLTVGTGGTFATIQAAVDRARPGDTVSVAGGTYQESVNLSRMGTAVGGQVGNLTIRGASSSSTTIVAPTGSALYNASPFNGNLILDSLTLSTAANVAGEQNGLDINGMTGDLSLADMEIKNIADHGISIRDLDGDMLFSFVDIADIGSGVPFSHGFELIDVNGRGVFESLWIQDVGDTGGGDVGIYIENNGNHELAASFVNTSNVFGERDFFGTTDDGIRVELNDSAKLDLLWDEGPFWDLNGHAVVTDVHDDAQLSIRVSNSDFLDNNEMDMMRFNVDGNGRLNLDLFGNSLNNFDPRPGSGVVVFADDNATANVSMKNEVYSTLGLTASDRGVFVTTGPDSNALVNVLVSNVTVSSVTGNGIHVRGGGTSTINLSVVECSADFVNTEGGTAGIYVDQLEANDTVTINMDIRGNNTADSDSGADSIRIHQRGGSQFNLVGLAANARTQLENANSAETITVLGTVNLVGAGTIEQSIPVSISGRVWFDDNEDGILDPEETNAEVGTVLMLNGTETATGRNVERSTTTVNDAFFLGVYHFAALLPGNYTVTVVPPAGYVLTDDSGDSDFDPATRQATVTVSPGGEVMLDAGLVLGSATPWQNPVDRYDVSDDGNVFPIDALLVINALNNGGARNLPVPPVAPELPPPYVDVSGDNFLAPLDALQVINRLNAGAGSEGEGESALATAPPLSGSDARVADLEDLVPSEHALPDRSFAPPVGDTRDRSENDVRDSSDDETADDETADDDREWESLLDLLAADLG